MAGFDELSIRINGQKIEASWFNTIRLLLIQIFGDSAGQVGQNIGNTDTNQDVTEISGIDKAEFDRIDIEYHVKRSSSSADLYQAGRITLLYKLATNIWTLHGDEENILGDDALITFTVFNDISGGTNKATLRYSTTDIGGTGITGQIVTRVRKWTP